MQDKEIINYTDRISIKEFPLEANMEMVLRLIDCHPDSPIYEDVVEEYNNLIDDATALIEPTLLIQFGKLDGAAGAREYEDGEPACYVFMTVGDKISRLSKEYFEQGDYLAGMLVNAIADDYLFQLDQETEKIIRKQCQLKKIGVMKRLQIPGDMPMEAQKVILEATGADMELNIGITEGYMFTVVKSNGYILILTEDESIVNAGHNCKTCGYLNCKMRRTSYYKLNIIQNNKTISIDCEEGESILDAMIRHGIYLNADCGHRGVCGKCKVQVVKGNIDASPEDKKFFKKVELEKGLRLSCKAYPKEECTLQIDSGEADFEVITDNILLKAGENKDYGIAVDIGTTTIAISMIGLTSKSALKTYSTVNKQRAFGADVISRIQASNDGKKEILQDSIRKDLLEGFRWLIEQCEIPANLVKCITIAGNTTMGHLLMGFSCETLGVYPFTPVNIGIIKKEFKEIFESEFLQVPVILLPGISTFVGADIAAGLVACNFDRDEAPSILIDLGTNGEMAIGNREKILVTSTAAGPAFEGGNISCGTGSIPGAICSVSIDDDKLSYKTIGDRPPIGLCGTGVLEITAELIKSGIVDETGLLEDTYFDQGYQIADSALQKDTFHNIIFTQKDIREIQLAKAAVRAGLETLILRYGITYDQVGAVYLAGGFGFKINVAKAVYIGLLPKELQGKIKAIGNSSLAGAIQFLTEEDAQKRFEKILSVSQEISLSTDKDFNELYIENMYFE